MLFQRHLFTTGWLLTLVCICQCYLDIHETTVLFKMIFFVKLHIHKYMSIYLSV